MTAEKFANLLDRSDALTKDDFAEIQRLSEQFPYFQSAHIMLLRHASLHDKKNATERLVRSGIFITDRSRLFESVKDIKLQKAKEGAVKNNKSPETKEKKPLIVAPVADDKQKLEEQLQNIEKKIKVQHKPEKKESPDTKESDEKVKSQVSENDDKKEKAEQISKDMTARKESFEKLKQTEKNVSKKAEEEKQEAEENEQETLSENGSKAHNALVDDLFLQRVKKKEEKHENKSEEKESEAKKIDEISSDQLTEDIYNKIAGLKNRTVKEKSPDDVMLSKSSESKEHESKKIEASEKNAEESNSENHETEKTLIEEPEHSETSKTEEKTRESSDKKQIGAAEENNTESHKDETSAADLLVSRIKSIKNDAKNDDGDEKKEEGKNEKQKTDEKTNKSSDKDDLLFEVSDSKKNDAEHKEEKTAADSILERINRIKTKDSNKKGQLIDEFVKKEPRLDRSKEPGIEGDVAEESAKEKEPVVTELMANIYINQGYYDKAIAVFEKLILKNPEKKDYFAAKIQETEEMK